MTRIIIGTLIIVLGISALLGISIFKFAFALLLVAIGVRIITGTSYRGSMFRSATTSATGDRLNEVVIFSFLRKTLKTERFAGGRAVVVCGGGEIDLRDAKAQGGALDLELVVVCGTGKLIVPKDWKVQVQGTAVLGGYQDDTKDSASDVTLIVRGAVILGSIEIANA